MYAKGDSGATTHYVRPEDVCVLSNRDAQPGAPVTQQDGTIMRTNGSGGYLPLHCSISSRAKKAQILPELRSALLVVLGPLCDDGCTVVLTDKDLLAIKTIQSSSAANRTIKMICGIYNYRPITTSERTTKLQ